ncbi:hypothetical protein COX00_00880 [Candidatus Uhrbacteria bacterium CG22_combo_CG10-13_8_21_14_all_47_17]|uniref:Glycosyl transferase family 1 n=1 Tax=Candidatus Uhrbacteria bacterium CG22_combo_CG10-13_8_21_14_all_47_17 TaxID=1975041 RepID=A0A2H0BV02_9BACT|nr:MAG: hypothetical protein COX00_00880 [Candidatus Uhrbacteria bacterium CG22_combo_CG10-13_8_21_14_all_47_17]
MKILHLSCVAPPEIGGIGRTAALEVAGLRARGLDAKLMAPASKKHADEQEKSFIEKVKPVLRIGNASLLPGILERARAFDVIHLHYPFYGVAEPLLLNSHKLPPIVLTYHMDAVDPGIKGWIFFLHQLLLQPHLLKHASRIIVSSFDYAHRSALRLFFVDHADRMVELPFGVDTDVFCPGPGKRERFMIPEEAFTLLFVGGLDKAHAFKGVSQLLEAFAEIEGEPHLMIVGDGDLRASYEMRAADLGITKRVHFLGRLDQDSLVDAYRSADVFVFPSLSKAEAFGLAALEAEACGLPVVASDLPGVRTVVLQGQTGTLVPPGDVGALRDAIDLLRLDPPARSRLAEAATAHATSFVWEKHIDGLIQVYREVCA